MATNHVADFEELHIYQMSRVFYHCSYTSDIELFNCKLIMA